MTRPQPILIGFFPRKTMARPDWLKCPGVQEVCSVSNCFSEPPENWINLWKHNMTWWLYDTEQIAWSVVDDDLGAYDVYAYRIFPVVFEGDVETPITVESAAAGNLSDFDFLGYDAVSREQSVAEFCHSPLSCNNGCVNYRVNRYCLMDDLEEAWRITREIAKDAKEKNTWEPGAYYLCEVHRKRRNEANQASEVTAHKFAEPQS